MIQLKSSIFEMFTIHPSTRNAVQHTIARWYQKRRRDLPWRQTLDPYAVWVSEVMLQQTQVKTVVPYFQRFMEAFADVKQLAHADEQRVLKLWEGLGYYSRARNLHRAARLVVERFNAQVPDDWHTFRQLPGVGDYIGAAVLSIAFSKPYAVVDGNVKRVLARLFMLETEVNVAKGHAVFQPVADQLLERSHPGRHNQAVMELGAMVCTPRQPLCAQCPLQRHCKALKAGQVHNYPRRTARKAVGRQRWAAAVVFKNGRLLLTQRPGAGLLAGMWEFPGGQVQEGQDPAQACSDAIKASVGLKAPVKAHIVTVNHTYTHFKLQLDLYLCPYQSGRVRLNGPAAFKWIAFEKLSRLPLHRAVHKALPAVEQVLAG